jgi:hypothetical protein
MAECQCSLGCGAEPTPDAAPPIPQGDFIPIGDTDAARRRRAGLNLLRDIFAQAGHWSPDPRKRWRTLLHIENSRLEWDGLFADWAERWLGVEADEAITHPDKLLCDTLRDCIR